MKGHLANLRVLLQVPSFSRWPLGIRFFCEEMYLQWQKLVDPAVDTIPSSTQVVLDLEKRLTASILAVEDDVSTAQAKCKDKQGTRRKGGVHGIEVDYVPLRAYVEKSTSLLNEDEVVHCAVCARRIEAPGGTVLVCPTEGCRSASHLTCLSKQFVEGDNQQSILPIRGTCPECKSDLRWVYMVKEMTLRTRGTKEIQQLMKKCQAPKAEYSKTNKTPVSQWTVDEEEFNDDLVDWEIEKKVKELRASLIVDEPLREEASPMQSEFEDDDTVSVTSARSDRSLQSLSENLSRPIIQLLSLDPVIEDID